MEYRADDSGVTRAPVGLAAPVDSWFTDTGDEAEFFRHVPAIMLSVDGPGVIQSVNDYGAHYLGYQPQELPGVSLFELIDPALVFNAISALRSAIEHPERVMHLESCLRGSDGRMRWLQLSLSAVVASDDSLRVFIACADSSRARKLSEALAYQSRHDQLTGLGNRDQLNLRMADLLHPDNENAGTHVLCFLDLDQFKVINDTCGHVAGDELLTQITRLLRNEVRRGDLLVRLGGDEFAVLMENCSAEQAEQVAQKFRQVVSEHRITWEGRRFGVSVSIGLAAFDSQADDAIKILQWADEACHAAKDAGRNRVHTYHREDIELAQRHSEMERVEEIIAALEEDRFQLYFQTIMPLGEEADALLHYEILVRMLSATGELVAPIEFLGAAERYFLSPQVDRWVVEHVFKWLVQNPDHLNLLGKCSINLSGLSLGDADFIQFLQGLFNEYAVPPSCICFEITETAAIANLNRAVEFIENLREIGCSFALDDFGSGLSSFAYLKTLPVDYLKIDGVFVKDIENSSIDFAMVKSINEIGKVMGVRTMAEFVENDAILAKLREIKVDFAQGYGVAEPRPIDRLLDVES